MRREEVSFLQADCEMGRLRDGQMTLGPESGPGVGPSPCYLSAPGAALSALRPGSSPPLCVGDFSFSFVFFWQVDPPPLHGPSVPPSLFARLTSSSLR